MQPCILGLLVACGRALMLLLVGADTLDTAIVDRLDEHIRFPKPNLVGRRKLLQLYFEKHLLPRPKKFVHWH